ncbi:hypothetical protein [Mesorhizobium sp. ANAO-SY3R2]
MFYFRFDLARDPMSHAAGTFAVQKPAWLRFAQVAARTGGH